MSKTQLSLLDPSVFQIFAHPGEVVEVRVFGLDGKKPVHSGYFDQHEPFCKALQEINKRKHTGAYFTLQVIDPRLLARAYNRIKISDLTTSDRDVLFYRWLPVDLDPVRPAGISSSDSELQEALDLREPVTEWVMQELGFDAPISAMSGNGAHLLFKLPDLPANEESKLLIKNILEDLSDRFSTQQVAIDTKVFNPARIWKLYGTTSRKGDEVPAAPGREARPHRMAYIDLGGNHGDC